MNSVTYLDKIIESLEPVIKLNLKQEKKPRWRFIVTDSVQTPIQYVPGAEIPKKAQTSFVTTLQKMQELFDQASLCQVDNQNAEGISKGLKAIQSTVAEKYKGWQNKQGLIHWIKWIIFGNAVERAYNNLNATLLHKIQEVQNHQLQIQSSTLEERLRSLEAKVQGFKGPERVPNPSAVSPDQLAQTEASFRGRIETLSGRVDALIKQMHDPQSNPLLEERLKSLTSPLSERIEKNNQLHDTAVKSCLKLVQTQVIPLIDALTAKVNDLSRKVGVNSNVVNSFFNAPLLKELIEALAKAIENPFGPIQALNAQIKSLKDEELSKEAKSYHEQLLTLLTPEMLRKEITVRQALQKFLYDKLICSVREVRDAEAFFPALQLKLGNQTANVNRPLAQALSLECAEEKHKDAKEIEIKTDKLKNGAIALDALARHINYNTTFQIDEMNAEDMFRIAHDLKMDDLKDLCRQKFKCDNFYNLKILAHLATQCDDLELKIQCLKFIEIVVYAYSDGDWDLPPAFKKIANVFASLTQQKNTITFKKLDIPTQQAYKKIPIYKFMTAEIDKATPEALQFCKDLGIECIRIKNSYDNPLGLYLTDFLSIKMADGQNMAVEKEHFKALLSSPKLVHLDLTTVSFDNESADAFCEALASNTYLKWLDLNLISFLPIKMQSVCTFISRNTSLEFLELSTGFVSEVNFKSLGRAVFANRNLKALSFCCHGDLFPNLTGFLDEVKKRNPPLEVAMTSHKHLLVGQDRFETIPGPNSYNIHYNP